MNKAPAETAGDFADMTILIVDDEQGMIDVLSAVLQRHGFRKLLVASNGHEALSILGIPHPHTSGAAAPEARHVDLVVLDVMLPDITGFDVCLAIKNRLSPHLPVLLTTGYTLEERHASFIASGADDFLAKPFRAAELLTRVKLHLARKRQFELRSHLSDTTQQGQPFDGSAIPAGLIGQRIGEYLVTGSISWSGASLVLSAQRLSDRLPCVIKMLSRNALEHSDVVQRFNQEAQIMHGLDHPNVVCIIDQGHHDACPYCVLEYLDGKTLETIVCDGHNIAWPFIRQVARDLALGLAYIHSRHIVHRDIKPRNVYVLNNGITKIGDFGIALILGDMRVTQQGYSIGTPIYMAPEQFEGTAITPATDIYSYGACLYHLIAGQPPFSATSAMEMLRKHLTQPPPPLHELRPDLPDGWNELIVERCLAKHAENRPASMTEVLQALDQVTLES